VMVEVIRKVGNTYMCTPRAWIPFAKESRIRDDYGLNRVEYRFTYRQQDSAGVVNTRAAIAAGLLMGTPSVPNLGSFIFPAVFIEGYRSILRPVEQKEFSGVETLDGFAELMRERAPGDIVSRVLRDRLKEPAPQFADSRVIREFDFKFGELFDLQKLLPDIEVKDENKYQPRYTIQLTVSATDSNVEQSSRIVPTKLGAMIVGGPAAGLESSDGRTADNKETFTFTIVSEADLLTEISKEEEGLIAKLDEIVTRLKDAQGKLTNIVDRLPTQKPEEMLPDSVTANTIAETAGKCRDMTQDLLKDYARILNEYKVNRLNKKLIEKLDSQIVTPLDQVSRIDFPALEEPLTTFNAAFSEQRKPDINVAIQARDRLKVIVDKLGRIRDGVGEIVSIKKVIELIQNVIKLQETEIKGQLDRLRDEIQGFELSGGVMPSPAIPVQNLQKVKVKFPYRVGLEATDDIVLKLEAPLNSELTVPAEVKVPLPALGEDKVMVEIEIQAGAKKGDFPVKVTPAIGRAGIVVISVK